MWIRRWFKVQFRLINPEAGERENMKGAANENMKTTIQVAMALVGIFEIKPQSMYVRI